MSKFIPLSYNIESAPQGISDVLVISAGNSTEYVLLSAVVAMSRRNHEDGSSMLTITVPSNCICLGPFGKDSDMAITNIINQWLKHR